MKKWTVVVEITDTPTLKDDLVQIEPYFTKEEISEMVMKDCQAGISFQIMECIEAPYGPQHKDGVYLDTRHEPAKCICVPSNRGFNPNCKAKVHR